MRQPFNVHVFLYRMNQSGIWEYAMFQRADDPKVWQGIAGGVEDEETFEQAAIRETFEEAGVELVAPLHRLDTISFLPSDIFPMHVEWGNDVVVCPMVHFAVSYEGDITLSEEHLDVKWRNVFCFSLMNIFLLILFATLMVFEKRLLYTTLLPNQYIVSPVIAHSRLYLVYSEFYIFFQTLLSNVLLLRYIDFLFYLYYIDYKNIVLT